MKYLDLFNSFQPITVVCLGDSTTSQDWCHPSWIDWLNFRFKQGDDDWISSRKRKVINSGLDGNDLKYTIENFDSLVSMYKPDAVILSLGFNDLEVDYDVKAKASELIKKIKDTGADLIIWSTYNIPHPKFSPLLQKSSEMYKELAKEYDALFINMYSEFSKYNLDKIFTYIRPLTWENEDWEIKPGDRDFMHCNEIGNQIIAQKILNDAFETDLSFTKDWVGLGNTIPEDLSNYIKKS